MPQQIHLHGVAKHLLDYRCRWRIGSFHQVCQVGISLRAYQVTSRRKPRYAPDERIMRSKVGQHEFAEAGHALPAKWHDDVYLHLVGHGRKPLEQAHR